jgi:hypothetical protein
MHQIFLALAVADLTLILISYGLGWFVPSGGGGIVRDVHFLVGLLTMLATLMVHGVVYTYFIGTGKWVGEVTRVYRLPEWMEVQAKRNKRRAMPFITWGMLAMGATVWLGAAADTMRGFGGTWHFLVATFTLGFTLGAFFLEYRAIVGQMRLLAEVKVRADEGRRLALDLDAAGGAAAAPAAS